MLANRMTGCLVLFVLTVPALAQDAPEAPEPPVAAFLYEGRLADGEQAMNARLAENPGDDQARFSLGVVQLAQGVERLAQSLYRYGADPKMLGGLPFLRVHTGGPNPNPEKIDYAKARAIFAAFLDDMARIEATLAPVKDPGVKLPLRLGLVRLDLNGDGQAQEHETLWRVMIAVSRGWRPPNEQDRQAAEQFLIAFDAGDVQWLRGYCRLLSALAEIVLAYDWQMPFEHGAHLFFSSYKSPHAFAPPADQRGFDFGAIADTIAMIHLIRLPVAEPQRMQTALAHLEAMIEQSKASWALILAETDDDHEWVPGPNQTSAIGARVSPEMLQGWDLFLAEYQAILAGKRLVPFWRNAGGKGVNLRRVFTEPREFDMVLWVQGSAAVPYLEEGPVTDPQVWNQIQQNFGGQFFGFAIWFN